MNTSEMWQWLMENDICQEETLRVITCINGYNTETLEDVLYAITGYRTTEQYEE